MTKIRLPSLLPISHIFLFVVLYSSIVSLILQYTTCQALNAEEAERLGQVLIFSDFTIEVPKEGPLWKHERLSGACTISSTFALGLQIRVISAKQAFSTDPEVSAKEVISGYMKKLKAEYAGKGTISKAEDGGYCTAITYWVDGNKTIEWIEIWINNETKALASLHVSGRDPELRTGATNYFVAIEKTFKWKEQPKSSHKNFDKKEPFIPAKKGSSKFDNTQEWDWVYFDLKTVTRFGSTGNIVCAEIPNSIDLTNHETAKKLLTKAKDIALDKALVLACVGGEASGSLHINVGLFAGSWINQEDGDVTGNFLGYYRQEPAEGYRELKVDPNVMQRWGLSGNNTIYINGFDTLQNYKNRLTD